MQIFVVSDDESLAEQIRGEVENLGMDCPEENLVPLAQGSAVVPNANVILVVMSPAPDRALTVIRDISAAIKKDPKHKESPKHLISVGPADANLILATIKENSKYINEADIASGIDSELSKLTTETVLSAPGKLISFLAPSGGSGASMIAANLATVLAREYEPSCLIDLKLGAGVLDALLNVKPTRTLAELCQNPGAMEPENFQKILERHSSGARLLAAPTSFTDIGYVTSEGVRQAVHTARMLYPYVLADVDRTFNEEQVQILADADLVIMVVRLDFTSLRNARQALEHLENLGIDRKRCRLVFNRLGQPREVRQGQAEEVLGMKAFKAIPDDPKTVNRAINIGVPVVLDAPRSSVTKALVDLAKLIVQELS
ncbi:Hypothetical protein PBC10988_24150 [Planctomycetales bacterium 10988]|nr:Hypothetical protein PBC10988_24150 [Planctomycetales bacterium 10988]